MSHDAAELDDDCRVWRERIERELALRLELDASCPARLREAMAYSLLAGGKGLRPLLTLLACEACGGPPENALPAACAIEMVHTYSLIHDDLPAMDDDDLRRGRPTSHKQFGEALAILAGDALLTLAFDVLANESPTPAIAAASCADLASAAGACGMVGGQVVDLECEGRFGGRGEGPGDASGGELALLESLHLRKTGRLLQSSLTLGARAAGASPGQLEALSSYGKSVGLAFQIADDLLDVTGERDRTGKAVGKDADSGKLTYPGLLGVEESRRRARDLVDAACGNLRIFGEKGRRLESLAHFVLERDH